MKIRIWSLGLLLALMGPLSHADGESGFYLGSGTGLYYVDFDEIDFDESAATIRIFGGYKLNDYVSFETGFTNLFESSAGFAGTDVDIDGRAWDLSVRPSMPVSDNFQLYGILGWTSYDFEISISSPGFSVSDDASESDLMYGVGGAFNLNDNWSLRGEWLAIDVDDADLGMLSVSASYTF